ncbi:MAG: hypothetical protein Q9195_007636 [Heterodermia aff. obscurata]
MLYGERERSTSAIFGLTHFVSCKLANADEELHIPHMNAQYREAIVVISASNATDVHADFLGFQSTGDEINARAQSRLVADAPGFGPMPYSLVVSWPDGIEPHVQICLIDKDVDRENDKHVYDNVDDSKRFINRDDDEDDENKDDERRKKDREDEIFQGWYASVQDYSGRVLSQSGDILIALGALAQEYQSLHDDELGKYLASLWTERLSEGLLWHLAYPRHPDRDSFIQPRKVVSEYHAQSWSWASCGQPVAFRTQREPGLISFGIIDESDRPQPIWCIKIMGCSVMPRNEHIPFGAVQEAHIDVEGVLMPIRRVFDQVWDGARYRHRCTIDNLTLLETNNSLPHYPNTDLFVPDSIEALDKSLCDTACQETRPAAPPHLDSAKCPTIPA